MAGIGANSSDKQVLGGLYTGLANLKVVAINPTFDEIKAMGINAQKDPAYSSQSEKGDAKLRLDFYVAYPDPKISLSKSLKVSIWLEDRVRTNKEVTKEEWINKGGNTAWGAAIGVAPPYDWYSNEGVRPCYVGEADLANFVKAWANVDPKDQAIFENISNIIKGDLTEVKNLHKAIALNQVKCLLGVKEGKYQTVYNRFFDRSYRTTYSAWKKSLEGDYGKFDADYQDDLNFRLYTGNASVASNTPTNLDVPGGAPGEKLKYDF